MPGVNRFTISALLATGPGERAEDLSRTLESMFRQFVPPDQLVLVLNGPVGPDQMRVVSQYQADDRIKDVRIVRLCEGVGFGPALSAGVEHCTANWIMRIDCGDESPSDRIQVQVDYVREHPDVDLIGGWAEESSVALRITYIKASPVIHDALVQALRWRNVLIPSSLLIRADTLRAVGGYRGKFPQWEEWDLYVQLLLARARFAVIPKVLVRTLVSMGRSRITQRGGSQYLYNLRFRTFCWTSGFIGLHQYALGTVAYTVGRFVRPAIRERLYRAAQSRRVRSC
jgi:glycosyltransferase involved in cell wall biosynthesis